ncbi:unnamed protein product [Durusdinium trenchii]|uniref:Uncharacterized protein n=2 Tax=Durusdinium trenchii TaxID=1381693 RepID=A0ABP0SM30_9DINO
MWRLAALPLALAVPRFDINLDAPPRERFVEVATYYKEEILAMMKAWEEVLERDFAPSEQADWVRFGAPQSEEFQEELLGMHEAVGSNVSLNSMLLFNLLYEMGSPTTACSGFLAANDDGQVIHGRNMDYMLQFTMPDGARKDWPDITFEATFWKGGQKLFLAISWPLYLGVHTGMRFGGWTFEQNTRLGMNQKDLNLAAAKEGGIMYGYKIRHLLETIPTFETALREINATQFMAPQYFMLSGAGNNEGAVISMDRMGAQSLINTPAIRRLGGANWFLLQTNDDANKLPLDFRRPVVKSYLHWYTKEDVSVNFVWDVIHSFPLKNALSVFTWVAVPRTNYSQLVLRGQEPRLEEVALLVEPHTDEVHLLQRFLKRHGTKGWKHVISNEGLRLEP